MIMAQQPPLTYILTFSIAFQVIAAIMSCRLIGITGRRMAWTYISMALTLMAVRRAIPLYHLLTGNPPVALDSLNESIGLVLSMLMVVGIARIGPIFNERKHAEDEIVRLNAELERRVLERTAQLEAANQEMEAFAYSVSHDLRAPLRGIDGFSLALLEDYREKLDEEGQDYLRRMREACKRMDRLIDEILKLSRITRSEMTWKPVNLSVMAASVAKELQNSEPWRKVEFVIAEGITAVGDSQLLRVLLHNLLGNAWKFTGRQPRARIEFGETEWDGKPAYFVRDNGAGFDMTYAEKLFTPFQRLHRDEEFPGTGVGLTLAQRIIHRHGGRIRAEGGVNKGATFYFTLSGGTPPATGIESEKEIETLKSSFAGRL